MPLSKTGRKVKRAFVKEYGRKRGNRYFYAYEHKMKKRRSAIYRKLV